jgi:hypothetical protein
VSKASRLCRQAGRGDWKTVNNTFAAIGIHHPEHRRRAIALGEQIGLYRDWPVSKGCIPPYVPIWVEAMVQRQG